MGPALDERRQTTAPVEPRREEPRARDRRLTPAGVLQMQRAHGNQAVQRMIRTAPARPTISRALCIVQAAYMSGDMFGIAAALTVDPQLRVLILQESNADWRAKREEQSELYEQFYKQALKRAGVTEETINKRVKRAPVDDTRTVFKDVTDDAGPAAIWSTLRIEAGDAPRAPGFATTVVGEKYAAKDSGAQDKVRNAFTGVEEGTAPSDEQMATFLTERGFVEGQKYALLWIRLSAKTKRGGAHPELDTSIEGVRQLKRMLKHTGRKPVLVGDRPGKNIVDAESIDMIKFWERAPFTELKGVNSRVAQLRLFEYMRRKNFDLISIGMRSGAMEGPALLGIPTIYIEEEGNEQHERMEKWVGKVPGWSQSKVRSLPTRTGKRFQGAGENVAGSANAMDVPAGEIANEMGKTGAATRQGLAASYNATWGTFVSSFSRTMSVRNIPLKAKQAMSRWHGAYPRAHLLVQRLDVLEANVQRASTNSADQVHNALRPARAHDINMGLGDYVGEVMTVLRPLNATPQAEENLKAAVRQWRSLWAGKADIPKSGFTETDLQGLFESPKIRDDRFAHIRAKHGQLLTSIDAIMNERAGSASTRLPTLERQDLNSFINAYIESAGSTIKLRAEFKDLKLAWATGSGGVRQALFDHTRKNADAGGWSKTMFPLVKQLHELLFPKLD